MSMAKIDTLDTFPSGIQDGIEVNVEMHVAPHVFNADGAPGGDDLLKERPAPGGHLRGKMS